MRDRIKSTLERLERQIKFVTDHENHVDISDLFEAARLEFDVSKYAKVEENPAQRETNDMLIEKLMDSCEKVFETTREQILSNKRDRKLVEARQIAMYIMRKYNLYSSLSDIGKFFNRDHSTVIHGLNNVEGLLSYDKSYKSKLINVESLAITQDLIKEWD